MERKQPRVNYNVFQRMKRDADEYYLLIGGGYLTEDGVINIETVAVPFDGKMQLRVIKQHKIVPKKLPIQREHFPTK